MKIFAAATALCALGVASFAAASTGSLPRRNGEIVFSALMRQNGDFNLYLVRPDGTKLRRITKAKGFERYASWSPDGRWLAYISNRTNPKSERAYELYVMRRNGTRLRRVTRDRWIDDQLGWAPDGKRFVFESNRVNDRFGIWTISLEGRGAKKLSPDGREPAWSPDGKTIAFLRAPRGYDEIWLMDPDGSNQRQLTTPPSLPSGRAADLTPDWSPDGKKILFTRSFRRRTDIYAINADGTDLRRLTTGPGLYSWPRWSPDGKRIVFVHELNRRSAIYVMNADGSDPRRVTGGAIDYAYPDWQPLK